MQTRSKTERAAAIRKALGARSIVLVGLMGCGKSTVGKRLAVALDLPFVDADTEIEVAAGKSIPEIFADHGEAYFRAGERRVIARILANPPQVLATGGGAFMDAETRRLIAKTGVSIWLKAELKVLMQRVTRRDDRPLLNTADPEAKMRELIATRHPVYGTANLTIASRDTSHEAVVAQIMRDLPPVLGERPTAATKSMSQCPDTHLPSDRANDSPAE